MNADLLFLCVDVATIVVFFLIALRVVTVAPTRTESRLIALISIASMCHVAMSRVEYGFWIAEPYRLSVGSFDLPFNVLRNLTPGLFALLTSMLFVDRRRQPTWMYVLLIAQCVLELLRVNDVGWANAPSAWLQIAFVAASIYWTIGYWRADLVEARRRMRAFVSLILAVNVVAPTILLRLVIPEDGIANYRGYVVISLMTLATITFLLFRFMDGNAGVAVASPLAPAEPKEIETRPDRTREAEDELALKRLNALLLEQHLYKESGLTLKALAERVGLPEYRMRSLIHDHLGFRNFNSFLHAYRIKEAAALLANPEFEERAVTAIAQLVGYDSVNTFNRGFKEIMGITPTAYRSNAKKRTPDAPNS